MKKNVALIYGGEGREREISKLSAENLLTMIDTRLYDVLKIEIEKDGFWYIRSGEKSFSTYPVRIKGKSGFIFGDSIINVDCAIPCLHGDFGEDGIIEGALASAHIAFVGQDVYASAVTSDKAYAKAVAEHLDIPTAKQTLVCNKHIEEAKLLAERSVGYPMFIKPARFGSSYGAHPVYNEKGFDKFYSDAVSYDSRVLVEELIDFDYEVECAFFEDGEYRFAPCGRIMSDGRFYDYEEKYIKSKDIFPEIAPSYDEALEALICDYSKKLVDFIGIRHLARLDYFVTKDKKVVFNEINAFPGMTATSLYPRLTELWRFERGEFINRLIAGACGV